ncbi:CHASE2 domain-containing protein [Chitinibacter sp. GC72]|uniref:CHASE2 domain-containing protein n=1 Tax=Chitinibacter sp. GC72 TaxID=1526917 RepID=UPI0018DF0D58|nr:adenylate/guanylate cyclase domain-containing protein [Chitinibacter sp. GC72]
MRYGSWVAAVMIVLAVLGQTQGLLPGLERWSYDVRVRMSATGDVPLQQVATIRIDDTSLQQIGRWPWPRETQAQLLEILVHDYGVQLIGLDIVLAEPEQNQLQHEWAALCRDLGGEQSPRCQQWQQRLQPLLLPERRLMRALTQLPVVGGMYFLPEARQSGALPEGIALESGLNLFPLARGFGGNWQGLARALPDAGFLNTQVDDDGVVRRVPLLIRYQERLYPALAVRMAARLAGPAAPVIEPLILSDDSGAHVLDGIRLGQRVVHRLDAAGRVLLPQFGPAGAVPGFSAADILHRRVDKSALRGKAVLIGATAPGLQDIRATPVSPIYPGLEAQASLLIGILSGQLAWQPPLATLLMLPLMVLIGGLLAWRFARDDFLRCHLWFALAIGVLIGQAYWGWQQFRWVLPVVWPLIMIVALYLWMVLASRFLAFRQHRLLKARFGEYIPPQIVARLDSATLQQGMSPEVRSMTVLFADVRDFTAIAEQLGADELAELLNLYLSAMTEQIHANQGVVDKYIGDAIMAFWGAPVADELQHAHAVQASLDMQSSLIELNRQFAARGWPELAMGIALHAGSMRVGNMGSRYRRAYTVMGDAVNVAARTESLTRVYQQGFLVTEALVQALPQYAWLEIDRVRVKGRQQAISLYTLPPANDLRWLAAWQQLRAACLQGDAVLAAEYLAQCRELGLPDGLYHSYRARLPNWPADGIWSWQSK